MSKHKGVGGEAAEGGGGGWKGKDRGRERGERRLRGAAGGKGREWEHGCGKSKGRGLFGFGVMSKLYLPVFLCFCALVPAAAASPAACSSELAPLLPQLRGCHS